MSKVTALLVVGLWVFAFNSGTISPALKRMFDLRNINIQPLKLHTYACYKLLQARCMFEIGSFSPLGEVMMTVLYFLLIWGFSLPLKGSETLLKIMEFFTSTSRVTEIYSQANYMSSQMQLQIFPHSSEFSKIISFSVPLWPPSANVTEIVSKQ